MVRRVAFSSLSIRLRAEIGSELRLLEIDIALIALMAYNETNIVKWLSTRPVLDAGLLSGIGAERSVE